VNRTRRKALSLPISNLDIRYSVHATEDALKVKKAVSLLFPNDSFEGEFEEKVLRGHYGNSIILVRVKVDDKKTIQAVIEKLATELRDVDKRTITEESNLYVDDDSLYLRFDKQAAFTGALRLQKADPICLRIKFHRISNKKTQADILANARELGLVL
jgi:RNA binding exosome subunit